MKKMSKSDVYIYIYIYIFIDDFKNKENAKTGVIGFSE